MNRRIIGAALMLGLATGLVTACSGSSSGSADSGAAAMPYQAEDASGAGESKSTGQGEKPGKQEITQPGVDRTLVRTATIDLAATDVGAAVNHARDITAAKGGYAGREEVREESATLTLHIPSDRFDQALDELSELGEVISRNQSAEDVTEQVVDLDSRLATQRLSVDRVRALLAKATTVDEIVRIEQEVTVHGDHQRQQVRRGVHPAAGRVGRLPRRPVRRLGRVPDRRSRDTAGARCRAAVPARTRDPRRTGDPLAPAPDNGAGGSAAVRGHTRTAARP